jgi:hypothetical protein
VLAGQPFEPDCLIGLFELRPGSPGEGFEVRRVPSANLLLLTALLQFLQRVLADGLEHPVARVIAIRARLHPDERLFHQPPKQPENILDADYPARADGLRALQREAAGKDGQALEQDLLLLGEQVVAPVQGRVHGPLPLGQVPCPSGLEGLIQPRQEFRGPEEPCLRCRELQREGQALEAPADRRHRGDVLASEQEGGRSLPGAVQEESGGRCIVHGFDIRGAGGVGHR